MDIQRIAVVGASQVGSEIARLAAAAGFSVQLLGSSDSCADKARQQIDIALARQVRRGTLTERLHLDTVARISPARSFRDLAQAQLVIEAATEDAIAKCELLRQAEAATADDAILASHSLFIPITKLAAATRRPEQFIGMHFLSPLPLPYVVEVVRGLQTSDQTAERVCMVSRQLGNAFVSASDAPGFIVNRLLIPLVYEACFALQEGLGAPEDIDLGAKLGLNHPVGPLELADALGLDVVLRTGDMLLRELGDQKYRSPTILRNYVAAGWLGCKSGRGFYTYPR